jgi:hypothetical protein
VTQQLIRDKLLDHKKYIHKHGEAMPEIRIWKWNLGKRANVREFRMGAPTKINSQR